MKIRMLVAGSVIIMIAFFFYSWQIEPNLLEVNRVVYNNHALVKNCTILFMTDLHIPLRKGMEKKLFQILGKCEPDIILLGGDIAAYETKPDIVAEKLRQIAGFGQTVMVRGNTDICGSRPCIYCYLKYPIDNLGDFPVAILRNETKTFQDFNIKIFGLDDPITNRNDTSFFKEMSDSNMNILLLHSIYKLSDKQKNRFNLILSGHTHGGQMFFLRPFAHWFDYMIDLKYLSGVFQLKKGLMIVSKGVGESFLPLRLGVVPEIHIIELQNERKSRSLLRDQASGYK